MNISAAHRAAIDQAAAALPPDMRREFTVRVESKLTFVVRHRTDQVVRSIIGRVLHDLGFEDGPP